VALHGCTTTAMAASSWFPPVARSSVLGLWWPTEEQILSFLFANSISHPRSEEHRLSLFLCLSLNCYWCAWFQKFSFHDESDCFLCKCDESDCFLCKWRGRRRGSGCWWPTLELTMIMDVVARLILFLSMLYSLITFLTWTGFNYIPWCHWQCPRWWSGSNKVRRSVHMAF